LNHGGYSLKTPKGEAIRDGELWVNLSDKRIDFKRHQRYGDEPKNNHYATYTPGRLDIVR